MQNLTEQNPILLWEKGTAADNAGDCAKAALFYALEDSLDLIEDQTDKIAELEKELSARAPTIRPIKNFLKIVLRDWLATIHALKSRRSMIAL